MKPGNITIKFDSYSSENLPAILEQVCHLIPAYFNRLESLDEVVIKGN